MIGPVIDFGIILPTMLAGASTEGIVAAAEVAERLGWSTAWTTDHVLVPGSTPGDYARIHEAIVTLGYVAGRHSRLRLGTSVIVVPQRNAIILAKELATLDALSGGRVIAGIGVGWNRREFDNLGMGDRFPVRGRYVEETIALWRHLWSGSSAPFRGRFHAFDDFAFGPLPPQGAALPIVIGGSSEAAIRRAGRLADGFHAGFGTADALRAIRTVLADAAAGVGRPTPALSVRATVRFDDPSPGVERLRGTPERMAIQVRELADLGVSHMAVAFAETDPASVVNAAERFAREVIPLVAG
jgi:probable F420-dependent oxidoreductase